MEVGQWIRKTKKGSKSHFVCYASKDGETLISTKCGFDYFSVVGKFIVSESDDAKCIVCVGSLLSDHEKEKKSINEDSDHQRL